MDHTSKLAPVLSLVEKAQVFFRKQLQTLDDQGGMTRDMYLRYLSFQYHLTKGVQRHFLKVAGHPQLAGKNLLREFLFKFGLEEEPHYKVAEVDLQRMGESPLPCPLDVSLWWSYFDQIVEQRPFVRLGATCVLENLGGGSATLGRHLLDKAPFLNKSNTRFITIHFHEILPHGDQIIKALENADLDAKEIQDLQEGANIGSIMYLRLAMWALRQDELTSSLFDPASSLQRMEEASDYSNLQELVAY